MAQFLESDLQEKNHVRTFWSAIVSFAIISSVFIVNGFTLFLLFPILLSFLLLVLFRLDYVLLLCVFITPFSINLAETTVGIGVSLPSEPLIFGIFIVYWLKKIHEGGIPAKVMRHPVTIVLLLQMAWQLITTLTSEMPLVSIKSSLARYCFISVFYFMTLELFATRKNINRFIWAYTIPLIFVIIYTTVVHGMADFSEQAAHIAMVPFYNDHTAYAAVVAFFIPVMISFACDSQKDSKIRISAFILSLVLIFAIILSYTRASWVGVVAAFCCYLAFVLRIKAIVVYLGFAILLSGAYVFKEEITMQLESNEEVSSDEYASHVQSIGNINSDDSNIERLNRWACALRMFEERPMFGYGPGTYMFQYGAFQKFSERSGISTNFAEGGGSHSEYLGPLSEQGFLALLLVVALIIAVTQSTSNYIKKCRNKSNVVLAKGILLGLVTYWVHGVLNYFLDTEKASVPYWGFIAILVALQVYGDDSEKDPTTSDNSVA